MTVVVAFQWRTMPAFVVLSFSSTNLVRTDVSAVLAPMFRVSWIYSEVVGQFEEFGVPFTRPARGRIRASLMAQEQSLGQFTCTERSKPLPVSLEPRGPRAQIMLGLDFLALFRETRLTFEGNTARLTMERR